jgi:hypothetical protein
VAVSPLSLKEALMIRNSFIVVILFFSLSCSQYRGVYRDGRYKSVTHSWKYNELIFAQRIAGTRVLIDTVDNSVVERTKFRLGVGLFGDISYEKKTSYDAQHKKIRSVISKGDRRVTVEYLGHH